MRMYTAAGSPGLHSSFASACVRLGCRHDRSAANEKINSRAKYVCSTRLNSRPRCSHAGFEPASLQP